MGCDISTIAVRLGPDCEIESISKCEYLGFRDYSVFAFLADVRNYEAIEPISAPRGYPHWLTAPESSPYDWSASFGQTWFAVQELLDFDYDKRCTSSETYREFLGDGYFSELYRMKKDGVTHIFCEFSS